MEQKKCLKITSFSDKMVYLNYLEVNADAEGICLTVFACFFQEPIGTVDLKQCITDIVGLIPRDVCARPNTFELRTVRRQLRGEADTLVTHCNNTLSTTRWEHRLFLAVASNSS